MILCFDETLKNRSDVVCGYGYAPIGEKAYGYDSTPPGDARYMAIALMSIEGPQSVAIFNTTLEHIDGRTFLNAL